MATSNSKDFLKGNVPQGTLPSAFMRELRPEVYSDTVDRTTFQLTRSTLEYHLDSVTSRNQTQEFEIFCRKLCERAICPNLRPQTGPEGGGDSKADTETYPVADEIAALTYVGEVNGGSERWAFAFSAKKEWSVKVRSDVKGIVETGRPYKRIIFVTSRFARAKDRSRLEDELSAQYRLPVTIHDRSWIVEQILDQDRADLAFNYLKIGESVTSDTRLGPTDYSRKQQLEDIESALHTPDAFRGMERQRVADALVAAKLSRGLERTRIETDGRFLRAIRLANADGTFRQQLEARYEQIWTAFWWYDDFEFLNASYDDFQSRAIQSDQAKNLEFLGNLNQLLFNSVIHGHMTREQCRLNERTGALREALEASAKDAARPNNSLEAETALLRIRLNEAILAQDSSGLSGIWDSFGFILQKATGLAEYDADSLVRFIELGGSVAGNDSAYTALVEKLSAFVSARKSEGEGAIVLLNRAQKLDFTDHFDIIRLLGKACVALSKKEYNSRLTDALHLLTLAYWSAGLLWAARASCAFAAASLLIEGEENNLVPASFVPTMKVWASLALELRLLPDFLFAVQIMNGAVASLPLTEESKVKTENDISELELASGSVILNLGADDLRQLESLPDTLAALGLFMARASLLYALGYEAVLRKECIIPADETAEQANSLFSQLASQPVAKQIAGPFVLNDGESETRTTTILGMTIEVQSSKSERLILVAETLLASLEAFFATAIEQGVAPHTESLRISITAGDEGQDPTFTLNELNMTASLVWPETLSLSDLGKQEKAHRFLAAEVAGKVLAATCAVKNVSEFLESLFRDNAVHHRIMMIIAAVNSLHRVTTTDVLQLSSWRTKTTKRFPIQSLRPQINHVDIEGADDLARSAPKETAAGPPSMARAMNHRQVSVRSVIDVHAWDRAHWRGMIYGQFGPEIPPVMALMFEDKAAAETIFKRWRERFGDRDTNEEIYLSVLRRLPGQRPHHYIVSVSSNPGADKKVSGQTVIAPLRSLTMEPSDSVNLEQFLTHYRRVGAFLLMPGILIKGQNPELGQDLALLKRNLSVKEAASVGEYDIEAIALRIRGLK